MSIRMGSFKEYLPPLHHKRNPLTKEAFNNLHLKALVQALHPWCARGEGFRVSASTDSRVFPMIRVDDDLLKGRCGGCLEAGLC